MSRNPLVLITEPLAAPAEAWLAARADVSRANDHDPAFDDLLRRATALIVRTYTIVDESLLARAPLLRVVARAGVGIDNIDVSACRRRGVEVVYAPDANTQAVVEFVVTVLLDHLRPHPLVDRALPPAQWQALRDRSAAEAQLADLTVGILGLGRIGRRVAQVLAALGSPTLYTDLLDIPVSQRHGARPVDAGELFARSAVVTIHVDGRPSNRGFVGKTLLRRLPAGAVIVNTSRGSVVDNDSLAALLRRDPTAAALLDVHEPEPLPEDHPLLGLPNAKLTPHLAGRTHAALEAMSWVVRDVWAVLEGRPPRCPAP